MRAVASADRAGGAMTPLNDLIIPSPFVGAPMDSKWPGACVVCGNRYGVGTAIVYCPETKMAAHVGCGKPAEQQAEHERGDQ